MSFMEREITDRGRHWQIETTFGTWYVPNSIVSIPEWIKPNSIIDGTWLNTFIPVLEDYVEPSVPTWQEIEVVVGYCGRLQAPGYLDCTEWLFDRTKRGIKTQLDDMFGD